MEEEYRRMLLHEEKRNKIAKKSEYKEFTKEPKKAPEKEDFRGLRKRALT